MSNWPLLFPPSESEFVSMFLLDDDARAPRLPGTTRIAVDGLPARFERDRRISTESMRPREIVERLRRSASIRSNDELRRGALPVLFPWAVLTVASNLFICRRLGPKPPNRRGVAQGVFKWPDFST